MLPLVKKYSNAEFIIPKAVTDELIYKPLSTKKYKLEALQILPYIKDGTIKIVDNEDIRNKMRQLDAIINKSLYAYSKPVTLLHYGELAAIAAHLHYDAAGLVIDERTTRYVIETPSKLKERMEHRLHTTVNIHSDSMQKAQAMIGHIRCVRSVEMIATAYGVGLFDEFAKTPPPFVLKRGKLEVLSGLLWALKLNGCAVTEDEIHEIERLLTHPKNLYETK